MGSNQTRQCPVPPHEYELGRETRRMDKSVKPAQSDSPFTLHAIEAAIRKSWGPDTCDETDRDNWSTERPWLGQCTSTMYVINDFFGGKLLGAEVHFADGEAQGHHYWNLLEGGIEIDLTLEQFDSGEIVGVPDVMERIHTLPSPGAKQYQTLRDRVRASLGVAAVTS